MIPIQWRTDVTIPAAAVKAFVRHWSAAHVRLPVEAVQDVAVRGCMDSGDELELKVAAYTTWRPTPDE